MLSSAILLLAILGLASAAPAAEATYCSEDNLLRAFQHTPTPAGSYCSTATGYPSFLAVKTYPPTRLTSACSCFSRFPTEPTSTSTSTSTSTTSTTTACLSINTAAIVNGGFESGSLSPGWIYTSQTNTQYGAGDSYAIVQSTAPGGGNYALQVGVHADGYAQYSGMSTFKQTLDTCPGTLYTLTFEVETFGGGGNYMTISVGDYNQQSVPPNQSLGWTTLTIPFTAQTSADVLEISMLALNSHYAGMTYYWDNFVVTPSS